MKVAVPVRWTWWVHLRWSVFGSEHGIIWLLFIKALLLLSAGVLPHQEAQHHREAGQPGHLGESGSVRFPQPSAEPVTFDLLCAGHGGPGALPRLGSHLLQRLQRSRPGLRRDGRGLVPEGDVSTSQNKTHRVCSTEHDEPDVGGSKGLYQLNVLFTFSADPLFRISVSGKTPDFIYALSMKYKNDKISFKRERLNTYIKFKHWHHPSLLPVYTFFFF